MLLRTSLVGLGCSVGFFMMAGSRARAEPGLGYFLHPLQSCDATVVSACEKAPADGKEHVHTFIINGCDPFQLGNLNSMAGYLRGLGFPQVHYQPFLGYRATKRQIREVRQSDPDAKIVLMGFSSGTLLARRLANDLEREGILLDRLVYLGGDYIGNTPRSSPSNVAKIVNIRAHGLVFSGYDLFFNGADIDNAQNVQVDSRHIVLPSRAQTMETLASTLADLAKDSHGAIAARKAQESPALAQPADRTPERSHPVAHPASRTRVAPPSASEPPLDQEPSR